MPDHRSLALPLALLVVALVPTSASAYTGERGAAPIVRDLVALAVPFWQARGVQSCETIRAMEATDLTDADGVFAAGRAQQSECTLWVLDVYVEAARTQRWRPGLYGDDSRLNLCRVIFHEVGHLGGLEHTETGVMRSGDGAMPYECRTWNRRLTRGERRAYRTFTARPDRAHRHGRR